jgi:hypothetical protein
MAKLKIVEFAFALWKKLPNKRFNSERNKPRPVKRSVAPFKP